MRNVKVNYLVGTWSGQRNKSKFDDGILKRHLEKLDKVRHSLSQISVGHPYNPDERREYTDWIRSLKETTSGIPIKVYDTDNNGRSYGQWSHMFDKCRNKFTHFIFIEDDYVPVKDDFDKILVDLFERQSKLNKCGFLCGLIFDQSGRYGTAMKQKHAAVANGISSNEVLSNVWRNFKMLPHDQNGYSDGQILFSQGFMKTGYTIQEYLDHYRCLYWQHCDKIRWYWDGKHNEDIIVPLQYAENPKRYAFEEYRPETTPDAAMKYSTTTPTPTSTSTTPTTITETKSNVPDRCKRSFQLNAQPRSNNQSQIIKALAKLKGG